MPEQPRAILLVKLSSIGDVVHCLPVLAAVRRRYPDAHLAWAVGPAAEDLVAGNPHLDETLVLGGDEDQPPHLRALPPLSAPRRLREELHRRGFDLALDLQGLFKTALIAYLSGAPRRIGFRNLQEGAFLLNNQRIVPDRRDCHAVEGYLGFAHALGAPTEPLDFSIAIAERDREIVDSLLAGHDQLVALVPGARWPSKRWPAERFAAVADYLASRHRLTPVILGSAGDRPLADRIQAASRAPVISLCGQTSLKQLAEVLRRCRLTVANDTGPMHISAAMGTPTLAIFGPTDPRRLAPFGKGHAVACMPTPCAPCRRRECRHLRCLEAVSVEQVLATAELLLSSSFRETRADAI